MPEPFAPRSSADTTGRVQQILTHLEDTQRDIPILRALANSPHTFRPFLNLTVAVLERSPLPATDREVVILHLAALEKTGYEWSEHVRISADAGVTDAQREALENGVLVDRDRPLFSPSQLLAIALCDELRQTKSLSPQTMGAAIDQWGEVGTLDLIMAVGIWGGLVPVLVRGLGLTRTPTAPPPPFLEEG
jgi:hypothetical protein